MTRSRTPRLACSRAACPFTRSRMLPVSARIAPRSSAVSPWPNSFWNTARGLPSCGSDCVGVRQRQARADLRRRQLERRQPRVLADVLHGQLVGGDAGVRLADAVLPRLHAAQPRRLDVAVRLGRFARLVAQARHDRQVLPQRLERLQDRRHVVVGAGLRRRPLVHDGAVREADEREPRRRLAGRRLRPGRARPGSSHRGAAARWWRRRPSTPCDVRCAFCDRYMCLSVLRLQAPGFRLRASLMTRYCRDLLARRRRLRRPPHSKLFAPHDAPGRSPTAGSRSPPRSRTIRRTVGMSLYSSVRPVA